jgi:DNA-binding CsgD family transcriptional regulator
VYGMRKNPEQTVIPSSVSPPPSLSPVPLARSQISSSAGLTVREREVLCLLTQGLTNPQIAKCLVISLPTVNTHVGSIYKKLNVSTRSAATRYAIERHLV